jgi:uncharacterized membrane protein YoaT (DUF817 family)
LHTAFWGALQLGGTVLILAFVPGSILKSLSFLAWWILTFGRLAVGETLLFVVSCALFTTMDMIAVRQGIFSFSHPDIAGLPLWEAFLWGFYILHGFRVLQPQIAAQSLFLPSVLAGLFCAVFALAGGQLMLLALSGGVLVTALLVFHEREDLLSVAYFMAMGAIIEYAGVLTGQWSYPEAPLGGVAPWFLTLWGGVGLFLRRLGVPLMARLGLLNTAPAR